jgi:hypothetical protein
LGFGPAPATRRKQATMSPMSLERILESAIVTSWPDLTRGTSVGLIHIEYGFAAGGTLDYLKVWSSLTRGHWLLACEYWMSANNFHSAGIGFENGYRSEGLAQMLEVAMQHQNSFVLPPKPRSAGTTADINAYCRRKRCVRIRDNHSLRQSEFEG